jgi:hypothetical protein
MTYSRKFVGNVNKAPAGGDFTNNTGSFLAELTPVSINAVTGYVDLIDVSNEDTSVIALVANDTPDGQVGELIFNGRVKDVAVTGNFGDVVVVSKSGGLTTIDPEIGVGGFVAGDLVIVIGVLGKNNDDPLKKDLFVSIDISGAL